MARKAKKYKNGDKIQFKSPLSRPGTIISANQQTRMATVEFEMKVDSGITVQGRFPFDEFE